MHWERLPDLREGDLCIQPLPRAETIPASWYTHPGFDELDRRAVFHSSWQYLGPRSMVGAPGQYFLAEICGEPLIVVGQEDGSVKAFFNVCRHRGGPLATEDGCTPHRMLQCQYHGWTYRLDGSLRGMPRFRYVELFDRDDYGLVPVRVEEWQGLLFGCLGDPPTSLSRQMSGIEDQVRPTELRKMNFHDRVVYTLDCNWKVYVDNYLEGYHLPYVHPELCSSTLDYRNYRTETTPFYSVQSSPLQETDAVYGGQGSAFYYLILPNAMLNVLPDRLQTNVVLPEGHRRCRVFFDYFYASSGEELDVEKVQRDHDLADEVQREDIDICDHVQKGLESSAYDRGRFSVECEEGVYHFQCHLKEKYRKFLKNFREEDYDRSSANV